MKFWSGQFNGGAPNQLTTIQDLVKRIEFFGFKSWVSGMPTANGSSYNFGLEPGALPYIVNPSGTVSLDYGTTDTFQDTRNFYLKGTSGDGYYVISHL